MRRAGILGLLFAAAFPLTLHGAGDLDVREVARQAASGVSGARSELEAAARRDDAFAAHLLGLLYLRGAGVPAS
ncbi:MAG TPA: hypothetical protein VK043_16935, partial [Burkholderiales bacterium]|nr:hypothetical protein [Burkholderiales bacterium]